MKPCPSRNQFEAFLDDQLDLSASEALEEHLEQCADCQRVLEELTALPMWGSESFSETRESVQVAPEHEGFLHRLGQAPSDREAVPPATVSLSAAACPVAIGRYRTIQELGQGSFGRVYLARDDDLDRLVAIKVPNPERVAGPEDGATYLAEARILAQLDHPHVVPVYDVGRAEDGKVFIVSKFIEGRSLEDGMRQGRPSYRESAELVAVVAEALHHAHRQGLVHRDIKPANILLDLQGQPWVADFGLALRNEDMGKRAQFAGTPDYMSPEQARGEGHRVDGRSDIFSLGAVFYELLTNRRPFLGDSSAEVLAQVATVEPRPPRQIDDTIPRELERVVLKALSKRATERYTTASDLAEDLRHFIRTEAASGSQTAPGTGTPPLGATKETTSTPATPAPLDSDGLAVKIIPKGLRSFDQHDADFFLELIPGPRDRNGLPESLRFWKTRIEATDSDASFKVGLIYGPSGCGKSSLIKAGLLPRLAKHVLPVYLEATPLETDTRLLKAVQKACPELSAGLGLVGSLTALRRMEVLRPGGKVLLVLDQFEHWLLARGGEKDTELVAALRQCDGERVQAIVLVRDDFWMAASRFMRDLEIDLEPNANVALVDLFDLQHARKVLSAFGGAYGKLPERSQDQTREQKAFLNQAVAGLAQDNKVVSVRLALFAEMFKGKDWTPTTLREVGGTEGVGLTFLEEAFVSPQANPKHRLHQKAAQSVLKALLPQTGTDIKGQMRSEAELREASGYAGRPSEFDELVHILDPELRLITPTDPVGVVQDEGRRLSEREGATPSRLAPLLAPLTPPYYQLTHDYLVHSLRDWLTRKQRETRRGRAELRLAESAVHWNAKPENRRLPSILEWAKIRLLTHCRAWTDPQRTMMKRAGRLHGLRGLILATLFILMGWGGYEVNGRLRAQMLLNKLLGSPLADVRSVIGELKPYRRWIDPLLRQAVAEANEAGNSQRQLNAGLALLEADYTQLAYLRERLLSADAQDTAIIRQLLASHKDALIAECWRVLEVPVPENQGKRLPAASALALYEPQNRRWAGIATDVANQLVAENAYVVGRWIDALHPVSKQLYDPLNAIFHDEKRRESERTLAASALSEYVTDQPQVLAALLMDATEMQFAALYSRIERASDEIAPVFEIELDRQAPLVSGMQPADADSKAWEKHYKRQANAAVALIQMGRLEKSWLLLKHSPDPTLRSYLVHRLGPLGCNPSFLVSKLDQERDVSIRRALILSLGELGEGRLSTTERNAWTKHLLDLYRNDPDPGIHGAAEWLLRQWENENQIQAIDKELGKLPLPALNVDQGVAPTQGNNRRWYVNSQGQTMVIVRGPVEFDVGGGETRHRERIGHSFAIAAKEVTVEQFQRFLKENPRVQAKNNEQLSPVPTCPVNSVSWYDTAAYCNWLSKQDGITEDEWCYGPNEKGDYAEGMKALHTRNRKGYRLPPEAESEYSCRAGAATAYSFGEAWELLEKYGGCMKNSPSITTPVGSLKPNDLGLFDLQGNVWEWCQDRWGDLPGKDETMTYLDTTKFVRVCEKDPRLVRGGTFFNPPAIVRSPERLGFAPSVRYHGIGLRPARTYD
jgi:serine/threonine protein kinase/formylglycine-generating enzyme required for sulfatase activity